MKRKVLAGMLAAALALSSTSAFAGYKGHHRGHHHFGGHYRYHNGDALAVAGILGGAIVLGALLSRPAHTHYHQPSYYHVPPPPPYYGYRQSQRCYQDQVWRYLPDGRVQTGTRTTCY